ncbi:MAG: polysulfide reductase NrfD [Actinomycetia bacterium]|nr:polysulfide reductase NrfD [Actinomycetes bacterium]
MSVDTRVERKLPQGVGRLRFGWLVFFAVAFVVFLVGLAAYFYQMSSGMIVTGMRSTGTMGGATWGLYIVMVEYFIGVSIAGVVLVAFAKVFNIGSLLPISRLAVLLTITSLVIGVLGVALDLGAPFRGFINMLLYARPQSPFFGTLMLVAVGVLFTSLVYLYLDGRKDAATIARIPSGLRWFHKLWAAGYGDTEPERERHRRVMFWLSIGLVPLVLVALSTEGLVFGIQVGRPGWYGSLQGPDFIVLAAASGLANLIVLAAIIRRVRGAEVVIGHTVFRWLGSLLLAATAAALYFQIVKTFTLLYATPGSERLISDALLSGPYAWIFWSSLTLMIISMILLVLQAARRAWSVPVLVAASVAVSTAAVAERYLTVIPSQTHGMLLPYEPGSYFPTWVEFAVVAGLFGLGAILIGGFMKVFPIIPLDFDTREVRTDA